MITPRGIALFGVAFGPVLPFVLTVGVVVDCSEMRLLKVDQLKQGLVLGRPLNDSSGQVLLNAGVVLSEAYIRALREKGFESVYIQDPDADVDVAPDEDISPETRAVAVMALRNTLDAIEREVGVLRGMSFNDMCKACKSDAIQALMAEGGPFGKINEAILNILDEVLTHSTLAGLTSIKSKDSQIYNHSIDVCVVAVMIGQAVHLDDRRMKQLAIGCLLHDIGKVFLAPTGDRIADIRQHTLLGFELLKQKDDPDILSPYVALEHHERQDGKGEPHGLKGTNTLERQRKSEGRGVTLIGEITAVANLYDNLLSGTHGQDTLPPDSALQVIKRAAGDHLNREVVAAFLRLVPVYPLGTEVLVRSGEYRNYTGIVTKVHAYQLDRPVITLVRDGRGTKVAPVEIDMRAHTDIVVRSKIR